MLDLNRIDTVNDANLLQPVPLGEHLQALIQEVQPVAQVHHIRLETQFARPCVISIYPPHLHSLLLALFQTQFAMPVQRPHDPPSGR